MMSKFVGFKPRRKVDAYEPVEEVPFNHAVRAEENPKARWRKRNRSLQTKPIFTTEFPKLLRAMADDGLTVMLLEEGYQWHCGNYPITAKAVREVWSLSDRQYRRLMRYVYIEGTHW